MEKQILYNMINNEDGYVEIKDEYLSFFTEKFKDVYRIVKRLKDEGKNVSVDAVEIYSVLMGVSVDMSYLANDYPFNVPTAKLIDAYVSDKQRELDVSRLQRLLEEYKKNGDFKNLELVKKELDKKLKNESNLSVITLDDVKHKQLDFIDRIKNKIPLDGIYIYRDGFKSRQFMRLSNKLKIIENTDLVVIAGRPSVGKTSFVLSLAHSLVKNGYKSFIFSLEMSNEQLLHRMAIAKSGVTNSKFFDVTSDLSSDHYNAYVDALNEIGKLPIFMTSKPPLTWIEIKEAILKYREQIDFVVVDHLGLIGSFDGSDKSDTRLNQVTRITRDMKLFCIEHKIPIILLSQFNRNVGAETRKDDRYSEPFMRDLRDSGSIEQDADKIIFLYRKDYGKGKDAEKQANESMGVYKINVKVEKNRQGQTGILEYEFNGALQRWKEEDKNES